MAKKKSDSDKKCRTNRKPTSTSPLEQGLARMSVKEVLELPREPARDPEEAPLEYLLWEVGWFTRADEDYEREDQVERVDNLLMMLTRLAADPAVQHAWEVCPASVSRLLTLTVAHHPVSVGECGFLDDWDWTYFVHDLDEDDVVDRLPRPAEYPDAAFVLTGKETHTVSRGDKGGRR